MAPYAIPSDKPFLANNIQRHFPTFEQKELNKFLQTHTVQLVGYKEDGTPIVEVMEKTV